MSSIGTGVLHAYVSQPLRVRYQQADIASAMVASDTDQLEAISQRVMQSAAPSPTDLSDASTRLSLLNFLCARSDEIAPSRLVNVGHTSTG